MKTSNYLWENQFQDYEFYFTHTNRIWYDEYDRCWRQMWETTCVDDKFEMLVNVLAILVTNIPYLLLSESGTQTQKISRSKFCHQHWKIVINIIVAICQYEMLQKQAF